MVNTRPFDNDARIIRLPFNWDNQIQDKGDPIWQFYPSKQTTIYSYDEFPVIKEKSKKNKIDPLNGLVVG
uniref:Uncharacterized protein n=1 Tax=Tetranychus urticae TaxID=32264 RepID=T1KGB4_TETUR